MLRPTRERLWHDDRARRRRLSSWRAGPPIVVALFILVFLDAQDAGTQLPQGLVHAVEQALGPTATVSVRPLPAGVDERTLLTAARGEHAAVIARVNWSDVQRLQGTLELRVLADDRRVSQPFTFQAADPLLERGRALGLFIAALLAPPGTDRRAPPRDEATARTEVAPEPPVSAAVSERASAPSPVGDWFLDAAAEGGIAVGGAGSGWGGTIGLGRRFAGRFGWRIGARARFGEVANAQADDLSAGLSMGVLVSMRQAAEGERVEIDLRLDGLLLYEALSHLSPDDVERVSRGRLVPGVGLVAEGRYLLRPGAAVILGAGPEVAFGRTDVFVHQGKVAELVPLRVAIHAGLRIAF